MKSPDIGVDEKVGAVVSLDLKFFDEEGKEQTLAQLINGKPIILALVYYRCPSICPITLHSLQTLVAKMDLRPGEDYRVLTISFNPKEDWRLASDQKRNYLASFEKKCPPDGWRFLTSPADSARRITEEAGFRYEQRGDMFMHPGVAIILTPRGKVTRYFKKISEFEPIEFTMALSAAREERITTARERSGWLAVCLGYNPKSGVAPLILRVVALATVLIILGFAGFAIFGGRKKAADRAIADNNSAKIDESQT